MSYRIYDSALFASAVDSHEEGVVSDVNANPGTDIAGIVLRTAKPEIVVQEVLSVLEERRIITRAHDTSGNEFFWTAGTYATAVWNQRAVARTCGYVPLVMCRSDAPRSTISCRRSAMLAAIVPPDEKSPV